MKILRKIIIIILVIIAIPMIIALFTKKDYSLEREITINRPKQEVFDYIRYLKNQDHYSKWVMTDPAMKKDFSGTDGTPGFAYAWESQDKNVGKGEQKIAGIKEGENMSTDIHFIKPFDGNAHVEMLTEAVSPNSTKVKWKFSSKMKYPMNFMLVVMDIEGMLGKDIDTSLVRLKNVLETNH
jgi:hypothetical protein